MTLYEFNHLDESEKAETTWSGVFIADREESECKILLYQIDSFYVEVYYHKVDNAIKRFRSFSAISQLDPYLKNINLDGKF